MKLNRRQLRKIIMETIREGKTVQSFKKVSEMGMEMKLKKMSDKDYKKLKKDVKAGKYVHSTKPGKWKVSEVETIRNKVKESCGDKPMREAGYEYGDSLVDPQDVPLEFGPDHDMLAKYDDDYYGEDEDPDYSDLDRAAREVPELEHYPSYGDEPGAPWHARPGDRIRRPADPGAAGYVERMYRRK